MLKLEIKTPGLVFQLPKSGNIIRTPFVIYILDSDLKLYEALFSSRVAVVNYKIIQMADRSFFFSFYK